MIFLYITLALLLLFIVYMRIEASIVEVSHVEFTKSNNNLKILHISDIHINRLKVPWSKVRDVLSKENPDIVIITGDCIEKAGHSECFLNFIDYIGLSQPTYLCLGNHDHKAFTQNRKMLRDFINKVESHGILVLNNSSACFEKGEKRYNIIGIDDMKGGRPDIKETLKLKKKNTYMDIAISHNPDVVFALPRGSVHYLFCGHLHGGQIWAPFNLEFTLLRRDRLGKNGIKKGLHRINGINVYINRGLGNVTVPFRFRSRPEISVYYLP